MDQTLEVRWFHDGAPPSDVKAWFRTCKPAFESDRTDRYLIGGDPSLNVKLRQGKLQLKRRVRPPEAVTFQPGVTGTREWWHKWSFSLAGSGPDIEQEDPHAVWRPVHKRRYQRVYSPSEQAALLDARDASTSTEVLIELTAVQSGPHTAWSICIEAEGPDDDLGAALRQMGAHLFDHDAAPALDEDRSHGYVQWLEDCYPDLVQAPTL